MPQPNKIPLAFAASGDKNTIPESTETTGLASWREGFPAITSAPFSEGGIAPKRADFNGIFYALSQAVMWMQQGGVYAYDVNTDYEAGNVVLDAGGLYVANAGNGPSSVVVQPSTDTTGATWKPVRLDLATQSAAGYMSAADKALVDSIPGLGTFNKMFFSQTSGNFIAPRTGIYRITLKGGGGGGGSAFTTPSTGSGGGGGEGGQTLLYASLIAGISYSYAIGAGGTGGAAGGGGNYGADGGTTSITVGDTTYQAPGGVGGRAYSGGGSSGAGGDPSNAGTYNLRGAAGTAGVWGSGSQNGGSGGGLGGGEGNIYAGASGANGGGGSGGGLYAGSASNGNAGGDGFILIEYAEA